MSPTDSIIFVVDDDESIRRSLRGLLRSVGFSVQVFASAQDFLASARPDVPGCLVLDVQLPGLSGLDLQRELVDIDAALPIIFLTGRGDIPMSVRAMKAGAVEFLTKPFQEHDLLEAIRHAIERNRAMRAERRELEELRHRYDSLTAREREVMAGMVSGRLTKQIAADFGTSEVTVKEQRGKVMLKMQVRSVADLVQLAARLGLTPARGSRTPPR